MMPELMLVFVPMLKSVRPASCRFVAAADDGCVE